MSDLIIGITFKRNKKGISEVIKRIKVRKFRSILPLKLGLCSIFHLPLKIKIRKIDLLELEISTNELIDKFILFHGGKETIKKISVWESNFPISIFKKKIIFKQSF